MVDDFDSAVGMVRQYGWNAFSSCLLYDRVSRHWCQQTDGFIGYLPGRGIHVALGEPVVVPGDIAVATREFWAFSRSVKADCVFTGIGQSFVDAVAGDEAKVVPIGDDLVFDVPTYAPCGDRAKKIRSSVNQLARRRGCAREYCPADTRDPRLEETFEALVATWLHGGTKLHLHFMDVDLFRFIELKRFFYLEIGGDVVGLLTCMPIFARDGFLFEDVIRHPDAPAGVVEMTVLHALDRFKAEGHRMATFGLSVRPRADGCRNVTVVDQALFRLVVPLATYFGKLPNHYHARKKFGHLQAEPLYLLTWPDDATLSSLFNLLRLFHII